MNFGKKILLLGLSLLVFLSVFSSIKTNSYILEEKLSRQNNSSKYEEVSNAVFESNFKDFLLEDSSFIRLFKDTKANFSQEKIVHTNGQIFITGSVQSNKKIQLNKNSILDLKDFSVFITKNNETVSISTFEKPVPIFIDDFPFLIPKNSSILIPSQTTTSIKELSHQDTGKLFFLTLPKKSVAEESSAREAYSVWQKSFREIVFEIPDTWKAHQKTGIGKKIRDLQNQSAFFIPKEKRAEWFFAEKMSLLFYGIDLLEKQQFSEAGKIFEFLNKQLKANESLYFFQSFPEFERKWKNYQNAIAIFTNFQSNEESLALKGLLNSDSTGFSQLENSLSTKSFTQAKKIAENMGVIGKNRAKRVRLFWNLYQNKSIQIPNIFRLFGSFDTSNLSNTEKIELKKEVFSLLEQEKIINSQETEAIIIDILLEILKNIQHESITTEDEKEFLFFTKEVKTRGLSSEEIENLRTEAAFQENFNSNKENTSNENDSAEIEKDGALKNTKMLISFLEEQGLEIIKNTVKSNKEDQSTVFDGTFNEQFVSGKFYYNSQYFESITINNEKSYQNIFRNEFFQIIELLNKNSNEPETNEKIDLYKKYQENSVIPQQTTVAILAKNSIANELQDYGFKNIKTNNIVILDTNYSQAQIFEAQLEGLTKIQLIFDSQDKTFKNLVGKLEDNILSDLNTYNFETLEEFIKSLSDSS